MYAEAKTVQVTYICVHDEAYGLQSLLYDLTPFTKYTVGAACASLWRPAPRDASNITSLPKDLPPVIATRVEDSLFYEFVGYVTDADGNPYGFYERIEAKTYMSTQAQFSWTCVSN